jgi:hypothetical protein
MKMKEKANFFFAFCLLIRIFALRIRIIALN